MGIEKNSSIANRSAPESPGGVRTPANGSRREHLAKKRQVHYTTTALPKVADAARLALVTISRYGSSTQSAA